jgi:hypothetical protein
MRSLPEIEFRECPHCHGYGVRDNGINCLTCGGRGRGGLRGQGQIGSGELMYDKATGRRISAREYAEMVAQAGIGGGNPEVRS